MSGNILHWGRDYFFVYIGNKVLWIPSKLMKIRFDWARHPEDLGYRNKQIKTSGYVTCRSLYNRNNTETGWGTLNIVGSRVLMTYYYLPSFRMAWIEACLYSQNKLNKFPKAFYLLKHRTKIIFSWLVHTSHSILVLIQINMLPLYVYLIFRKIGPNTNKDK